MDCPHPKDQLQKTGRIHVFRCGACGAALTARQVGLNPRARGTNPRAGAVETDQQRRMRRRKKRA